MTQLLVSCVVLYLAILTLQVATDDGWYQRRVDTPIFNEIAQTRKRHRKKGLGQHCSSSDECQPYLCCMQSISGTTTCRPRSRYGQRCTDEQVKSGSYLRGCPCLSRHDECLIYRRNTNFGVCGFRRWN
uniref:Ixodegrin B n=1 Tax=Rhipicephalus appendiculatus TaxID=34631 RepID=A0A131YT31_RHIAP